MGNLGDSHVILSFTNIKDSSQVPKCKTPQVCDVREGNIIVIIKVDLENGSHSFYGLRQSPA